ncbi:MAG: UvrD-helicase domain-containing protein, partial [Propionibacteriales bacterium]|nr:UvrD-helicase domain-containing protein [Propionibacteriales bacterium]
MRRRPLASDDLRRLIGIPFSDQQIDAITAPLEPGVIVAGAGSGKTTVMAARVVWAVSTGAVSPDQVLGLTFTNKAASELGARVRLYLTRAGLLSGPGTGTCTPTCTRTCAGSCTGPGSGSEGFAAEVAEPSVLTYHAYAARLLHEHGLRIGHEPETTVMSDASRFQLAERAVRRHRLPIEHLTTSMSHVVRYVLALDAQLS